MPCQGRSKIVVDSYPDSFDQGGGEHFEIFLSFGLFDSDVQNLLFLV